MDRQYRVMFDQKKFFPQYSVTSGFWRFKKTLWSNFFEEWDYGHFGGEARTSPVSFNSYEDADNFIKTKKNGSSKDGSTPCLELIGVNNLLFSNRKYLEVLVAREIFGYCIGRDGDWFYLETAGKDPIPPYAGNMAVAFSAVNKLGPVKREDSSVDLFRLEMSEDQTFKASWGKSFAKDRSPCTAICLAALIAKGFFEGEEDARRMIEEAKKSKGISD